jgi:hypothetical protein
MLLLLLLMMMMMLVFCWHVPSGLLVYGKGTGVPGGGDIQAAAAAAAP